MAVPVWTSVALIAKLDRMPRYVAEFVACRLFRVLQTELDSNTPHAWISLPHDEHPLVWYWQFWVASRRHCVQLLKNPRARHGLSVITMDMTSPMPSPYSS